jgi:hypothetical protein
MKMFKLLEFKCHLQEEEEEVPEKKRGVESAWREEAGDPS